VSIRTLVKEHLLEKGSMTFEQYMDLALYHQEYGYYMNQKLKIGKNGDFYTSSSVSDIFGKVWANVFMKRIMEQNLDPVIVEIGGGNGNFAKHVLQAWEDQFQKVSLTYIIVERSPFHCNLLKEKLKDYSIKVVSSLEGLIKDFSEFRGIVFANEVLDAFPIRVFQRQKNNWFEKVVIYDEFNNDFIFKYNPIMNKELLEQLNKQFAIRRDDFDLEISIPMINWLKEVYNWVSVGALLFFVDYGYKSEQWHMDFLKEGSLRGYYRHRIEDNPLAYSGEMDITYHVDWDLVEGTASSFQIVTAGFYTQGDFLLNEGLLTFLKDTVQTDPFSAAHKRNRAIRSFLLDSTLANGFQVLEQKKRSVK
jgi:SAM-dependent MidA family methyltransferase